MKNHKILVLGYFGYRTNQLDGQTVKTRDMYRLFEEKSGEKIDFFDTQRFSSNPLSVLVMLCKLIECKTLIYLPAHNNLKYIFPLIYLFSLVFSFKINYMVVGGWLVDYLSKKPLHRAMLSRINGIFTETHLMEQDLRDRYGMDNVVVFPNFRVHNFTPKDRANHEGLKIVFMSRINKKKGLDIVFLVANYIQEHALNVRIDLYGPIHDGDRDYFEAEIQKYQCANYCSVIEPQDINETLSTYDLLLLPTRYYTEGFPGAILDAYISGVPVLVSRWKHATEFVDHGVTGFICSLTEPSSFIDSMMIVYNDKDILDELRLGALSKSRQYSADLAWQLIQNNVLCG